jgi:SAM-dependent methyltransferase
MAPFDAAFFNAVFGNLHDQREALLRVALLLRPGGHIVISHPLGSEWLRVGLRADANCFPVFHSFFSMAIPT